MLFSPEFLPLTSVIAIALRVTVRRADSSTATSVPGNRHFRNGIVTLDLVQPPRIRIWANRPLRTSPTMNCACGDQPETLDPTGGLSRRAILAGSLAVVASPFLPGLMSAAQASGAGGIQRDFSFLAPQPGTAQYVRPMMFPVLPDPVLGKASWSDTFGAARGGGRRHEGQDLMGKKMLKLLACVDGTIVELRHASGGNSLYLQGDDGWYYCYLHINNDTPGTDDGKNDFATAFAAGLAQGDKVKKGDHIAYLGDSGNAEGSGAHCHFEIRMPNAKWYNASAVNAKYSLDAAEPAKLRNPGDPDAPAATGTLAPFATAAAFVRQQSIDFLGVTPTQSWITTAAAELGGASGPDAFIRNLLDEPAQADVVAPAIRLYLAYFLRQPDTTGLKYWVGQARKKTKLDAISQTFATSSEFKNRYGKLGNAEFVKRVYLNLFEREPDNGGYLYWTSQLDQGKSRGWVMRQLCESGEYTDKTADQVGVVSAYLGMVDRAPTTAEYTSWSTMSRANVGALTMLIGEIRKGSAYGARIAALG